MARVKPFQLSDILIARLSKLYARVIFYMYVRKRIRARRRIRVRARARVRLRIKVAKISYTYMIAQSRLYIRVIYV